MTLDQDLPASIFCPRCGGLMSKPVGSSFYWHATNDHPRCTITNIVDIPKSVLVTDEAPDVEPQKRPWKKKST